MTTTAGARSGEPRKVVLRILMMVLAYSGYALAIALLDGSRASGELRAGGSETQAYLAGGEVWRENACQTCHSIYGLGGHAGPDLTNALRRLPEGYASQVILTGTRGMPAFELSADELRDLIGYLAFIGQTGIYPPDSIRAPVFGTAP